MIDIEVVSRIENIFCANQEEADTKMFLCCQHAAQLNQNVNICISTVDSDAAILAIYYEEQISCHFFVEIRIKWKKRILSISKIHESLSQQMSSALPALHAMSGCDSTRVFYGIGKQKVYYRNFCSKSYFQKHRNFYQ